MCAEVMLSWKETKLSHNACTATGAFCIRFDSDKVLGLSWMCLDLQAAARHKAMEGVAAGKGRWQSGCQGQASGWTATLCSRAAASCTGFRAARLTQQTLFLQIL